MEAVAESVRGAVRVQKVRELRQIAYLGGGGAGSFLPAGSTSAEKDEF